MHCASREHKKRWGCSHNAHERVNPLKHEVNFFGLRAAHKDVFVFYFFVIPKISLGGINPI